MNVKKTDIIIKMLFITGTHLIINDVHIYIYIYIYINSSLLCIQFNLYARSLIYLAYSTLFYTTQICYLGFVN